MKRAVLYGVALVALSKAQELWIARPSEGWDTAFQAQAYRIAENKWVLVLRAQVQPWLPYAFDTLMPLHLSLVAEGGVKAETTFMVPAQPLWQGFLEWTLPISLAGRMGALYLHCAEGPPDPLYTRVYWPEAITPTWVESPTSVLSLPVRLHTAAGETLWVQPGQPGWEKGFLPARIDTSVPLPPYVLRKKPTKAVVPSPCAWYLRGDSARIFWSCAWPGTPYPCPGAKRPAPPEAAWKAASLYFSDQKPGERSDRGLIYLFYGEPTLRLLTPTREIWVYLHQEVSFHFSYRAGSWELLRRLEYQRVWNP